jgi:hypothetical protein
MILTKPQLRHARDELAKLRLIQRRVISMNSTLSVVDTSYVQLLEEQIQNFEADIQEYERLRTSEFKQLDILYAAASLSECLIKGRLAMGWSGEHLARLARVQNIDRHERNNYRSIRLEDALSIADVLAGALETRNGWIRRKVEPRPEDSS